MTLASATTKVSYAGNGSTASFSVTFVYWDDTDIEVILRSSAGVETTWVLNTQYTLSGGDGSTGTLTVDTSPTDYTPASGETLVIRSKRADTQGTALPLGGAFPSTNVEQAIDQIVRMVQQKEEFLGRTLSVPKTDTATDLELPIDSERASKFAAFDSSGNIIASTGPTGDSTIPVTSYIETLLDDSNSGAALTTLLAAGTAIVNTFSATQRWAKGGDLSSASPLVLDTDGNYFDVTGTTGFSAITVAAGTFFMLQFDGVLALTHGASLDLPGGANITTAAGDRLIGFAEAANTVQILAYTKADGTPLDIAAASQAQQETGTATNVTVTPGRQHHHPLHVKAYIVINLDSTTPTIAFEENLGGSAPSVVRDAGGNFSITHGLTFADTDYHVQVTGEGSSSGTAVYTSGFIASTTVVEVYARTAGGTGIDTGRVHLTIWGDQ